MKIFNFILLTVVQFFLITGIQASEIEKVVILGSGAAGSSAAIFAGQGGLNPLVIQDSDCNAQMAMIHTIDNYPGVLEEIEGVELLNKFRLQAQQFGARFHEDSVVEVDVMNRPFRIELASGKTVYTQALIIASGTKKRWLELSNETNLRGKGVTAASFCRNATFNEKEVVVIGGGHAALQEAQHVSDLAKKVTIVNRGKKFAASKFHQELVFSNKKIQVMYDTEIEDILDPSADKVTGVLLKNSQTQEVTHFPTDVVVVAIGHKANSELFQNQLELSPSGQIMINGQNTATNVPGVFAAGDVSSVSYGRVVIAAGMGAMAALDAIRFLDETR